MLPLPLNRPDFVSTSAHSSISCVCVQVMVRMVINGYRDGKDIGYRPTAGNGNYTAVWGWSNNVLKGS